MQYSAILPVLLIQAKAGKPVKALEIIPDLREDLEVIWEAFADLHASRQAGFVANPITFSDIKAWLDIHDYSGEMAEKICHYVKQLDLEWLKWDSKERKSKERQTNANTRSRNRR